jgi:hypothetical protein
MFSFFTGIRLTSQPRPWLTTRCLWHAPPGVKARWPRPLITGSAFHRNSAQAGSLERTSSPSEPASIRVGSCVFPSTGPRRVTPATLRGTVRPQLASLSASEPRSQPDVTASNWSATRYTCYAQRKRSRLQLGEVNRARPQAVGLAEGTTGAEAWASTQNPCKFRVKSRALWLISCKKPRFGGSHHTFAHEALGLE